MLIAFHPLTMGRIIAFGAEKALASMSDMAKAVSIWVPWLASSFSVFLSAIVAVYMTAH